MNNGRKRVVLATALYAVLVVSIAVPTSEAQRKLKPQPTLPIDCASYNQPCTGTECVNQQTSYPCDSEQREIICQNDTQNYVGGNRICCTGKNPCDTCTVNGRKFYLYSYNGVQVNCTPNP